MYCSNCGAKMDDDSVFCPECGARCEESAQTQAGAAPQEAAKTPDAPTQDGAPIAADAADGAQEAQSAVNEAQGAPQSAARQEVQNTAQQEPQAEASSTAAALAAAASRLQSGAASASGAPANNYFAAQFARIAAGEKPKFNWAAFFLAPFNQLYHGSTQVFKKTFLPYFLVMCLLGLAGQIAASATLATFSLGALAVTGVLSLASFGVGVWGFVLCILNGKNYTKKLYDQTQGRAEAVPTLKSPVAVLLGALAAWGVVLGIVSAAGAKSAADAWMDDLNGAYLEEDADWEESWEEEWDDEAYSDDTDAGDTPVSVPEQDSWLDLTALPQTDFENTSIYSTCMDFGKFSSGEGFDSVSVLGDSSVTVGTLFSMLFDTYSWETGDAMEAIVRDAVCQLGDDQVRLSFSQLYTANVDIAESCVYGADGSMTPMSQYDIACLMKALCDEYHRRTNTEPASPVRDVWGTWVSDDGQTELTIDSETYGGNKYSIIGIDGNSNMLKVSVQRNDGTIDDRWLQVIGDSMTVYEIFERDGVGDVVGYFTRIA